MPKIFSPEQEMKRSHTILPAADWDELAEIAQKANMKTSALIRVILQTSLKHFRDQARRAVDEVERDFSSNIHIQITIPNLEEIKEQARLEQMQTEAGNGQ